MTLETEQPTLQTPAPTAHQAQSPISRKRTLAMVAGSIGALMLFVGIGLLIGFSLQQPPASSSTALTSSHDGNTTTTTQEEATIASVAEKVGPSVVSIVTESRVRSFYGTTSQEGAGTGIVVSKDGYIMTNNHVVSNTSTVSVVDSNGELYEDVRVIGRDPLNDIAFLKIDAKDTSFTPAELGNSATLRTGQQVVAIGNALGQYANTVTSGIISGKGRPVTAQSSSGQAESLTDLLQTDASINPGNSGGPLVNMAGQVIGINTAIVEDANGIGFAIPINATKGILAGVLETGKVSRVFLGVNYLSITPEIAREYNLPVRSGAYIYGRAGNPVAPNSPAEKAGLEAKDIIQKINDSPVGEHGGLSSIIGQYKPGDTVTVTYLRDGQTKTTRLTFGVYETSR